MHKMVLLLLSLALVGCASTATKKTGLSAQIPLRNQIMTVVRDGAEMTYYVRTTVNGQSRRFKLDTGARKSFVLADEFTKSIPSEKKFMFAGASNHTESCDFIYLDSFEYAGATWTHAPMFRCESDVDSENYLGIDYFNQMVVSLDFSDAKISILRAIPEGAKTRHLTRGQQGHIELPVKIGGSDEKALFDTGAAVTVIDESFLNAHPDAFQALDLRAKAPDWTGHSLYGELYVIKDLTVGSMHFSNLMVLAIPFQSYLKQISEAPMVLGANAMSQVQWIFDMKNNLWAATNKAKEHDLGVTIGADEIVHRNKDRYTLNGNAEVAQPGRKLSADKIQIDAKAKKIRAKGGVVFDDNGKVTKGDEMLLDLVDGKLIRE